MPDPIFQIVTFHFTPGTTDAAFVAAAKGTEALLRHQPGFISRRLAKGKDGQRTDLVAWHSMDHAMADDLQVSTRTIRRDMATLIASGLPAETERGPGQHEARTHHPAAPDPG